MIRIYLKILVFVLILIGIFVYIGDALTKISGEGAKEGVVAGVSPEAGESIFWGNGKCYTCHSIGGKGSVIRCPNLENIGAKASERATQRVAQGKSGMSATDYLVETIANPSAYLIEGYKNEMPLAYKPPIGLKPEEVMAVITYLQSQGGEVDTATIKLPPEIKEAKAEEAVAWSPYMEGDSEAGKEIFFDLTGNAACGKCHKVGEEGEEVGPELTNVAGTRTPQFIIESILNPNKEIASGFESMLIITKDGRYINGVLKKEDANSIVLADSEGKLIEVPKKDIDKKALQPISLMPGNLGEILTMDEFHHVLAFLMTLK